VPALAVRRAARRRMRGAESTAGSAGTLGRPCERRHRQPAALGVRRRPQSDSDSRRRPRPGDAESANGGAGVRARLDRWSPRREHHRGPRPRGRQRSRQRRPRHLLVQGRDRAPVPRDGRQPMEEATQGWPGTRDAEMDGTIDSATPSKAALLGAALSGANPKNLALTLAAASIAEAGLDQAEGRSRSRCSSPSDRSRSAVRCSSTSSTPNESRVRSTRSSGSCPTTTRSS
jgi:hypothetical protein